MSLASIPSPPITRPPMVCFAFIHLRLHSYCEELFWMGKVSVRRRAPSAVRTKLKFIILEKVAFAPDVYGLSLMKMSNRGSITRRNTAATMESLMGGDDVAGVGEYDGAAAGCGALQA